MTDLYTRLGVSKTASTDEIRSAYKDLAKTHHPDRGGDVEKFKEIQEANEVLSDDGRRRMYDMTGSTQEADGHGPMGGMAAGGIPFSFMGGMGPFGMPGVQFDMGEMFGNLFGGGQRQRSRGGRGPNKFHDIGLKLSEFYSGRDIKLKFNQGRRCKGCSGSGAEATESCSPCGGSGVRTTLRQIGPNMMAQTRSQCDVCNGEGTRITSVCRKCQGKRFIEKEKQLDIKIKQGMREGEQLTFSGECSDSLEFDSPGDVILTLRRADMGTSELDEYSWKEDNLHIRKKVTYVESILGFSLKLDTHPNGSSPSYSWRGGPLIHGAVLKFAGGGMPRKNGYGFGDLFIQVMIAPPEVKPWSAEHTAKLHSVLGGVVSGFDEENSLSLSSAESQLSV